jgi:DNA-binding SARP family transcriptional activator/tetratricopeptide (TPR) repeat protein
LTTLDLSLLGGFSARTGGGVLQLKTRKAQALLSYLALGRGHSFERAQLCALLWGEARGDQAHSSLRQTLFSIRKALPSELKSVLICNTRSVALDTTGVWSDVLELERIVAAPSREALERVAALYRGPLLEGLCVDEPDFDEWLRVEQSRLSDLASRALLSLAEIEAQAGALAAAVQTRLQLGRLAPWDEDNHCSLMQLYARQGRRSAALAHYRACAETLRRDLGAEPDPAMQRLYQELAAGVDPRANRSPLARPRARFDSPLARPRARFDESLLSEAQVPPSAKSGLGPILVGRERELSTLEAALTSAWSGAGKVLLLVGEAGVGKTILLDALSARASAQGGRVLVGRCFESEQVLPFAPWVSALRAEALTASEELWQALTPDQRAGLARLLPRGAASSEDVPAQDNALYIFDAFLALLRQLAGFCSRAELRASAKAPLMLVLDDLHWADDMSLRLLSFLGRRLGRADGDSAPILIAATLRHEELSRGGVLGTALRELSGEECSLSLQVEPLSQSDTSLLVRTLVEARGSAGEQNIASCSPSDPRARKKPQVESLSPHAHAQIWSLSEGNPFVIVEAARALRAGTLPSDQGELLVPERVREVIAGHIARLSPFQQKLTALAAVIGREFDLGLLCAVGERDAVETAAEVEDLVHAGIFKASGDKLYFRHERIREVVYAGLLPQRRSMLHGHVARTLLSVHAEAPFEVYGSLATHFAKADDPRAAVHYFAAFADRAAASFGINEALNALGEARELATLLAPAERATWLLELEVRKAKCLFHLGRFAEIAPCLVPHVPLLDTLQRPDLKAQVHFWLGCASGLLGDTAAAASGGERALEEALRCGGVRAARRAHTLLAWEAAYAGRFAKGIEHGLAATISLAAADAEVEYQAAGFMTAGVNYLYRGQHRQAIEVLETAIALSRENRVARVQALSLGYAGLVHAELAEEERALALCAEALTLAPDPVTASGTLSLLLHVHVRAGRTEQARATFERLSVTAQPLGQRTPQGGVLIALAEAQLMDGHALDARRIAEEALNSARVARHPLIEGAALRILGQCALALGEACEAERQLTASRGMLGAIGAQFQLGRTMRALYLLADQRGDARGARRARKDAEQLYHELGLPGHAARVANGAADMVAQNVEPTNQAEPLSEHAPLR